MSKESVIIINGRLDNGKIKAELDIAEIEDLAFNQKKIVILKEVFPKNLIEEVKGLTFEWAQKNPPLTVDDFTTNYHCMRAKVSNLQQSPHVFHDYNFNDFSILDENFREKLLKIFEPLRILYNQLTSYDVQFEVLEDEPYIHPQIIHYPLGGGFFGRHNHNLLPQKVAFILAMSKYGKDYPNGGTCFEIENEVVDIEGLQDIGDLLIWRFDHDHWVKQSDLSDKFDWNAKAGRWVATLSYFNPKV